MCQRISEILGVRICRIVKFTGKDPTFHMELEEGKIEFASVGKLISQECVRLAIAGQVGRLIRRFKSAAWEKLAQAMLDACISEPGGEETELEGLARMYVAQYLSETGFIDALEGQPVYNQRKPIILDGKVGICASDLHIYINKMRPEPVHQGGRVHARCAGRKQHPCARCKVPGAEPVDDAGGSVRSGRVLAVCGGNQCGIASTTLTASTKPRKEKRGREGTREFRISGAPGTGKTTNIARQVRRAVARYGAESVLVTSFSHTAAAELAGRDLPIPSERIGTLHSHCYRVLGAPKIAESCVDEWNRQNPRLALTPVRKHTRLSGEAAAAEEGQRTGQRRRPDLAGTEPLSRVDDPTEGMASRLAPV